MRRTLGVAGAASLGLMLVLAPGVARGQLLPGAKINIAAGATFATGNFGSRNNSGYNVALGIDLTPPLSPLGFRAEGIFNEFDQNFTNPFTGVSGGKTRVAGITGNATFDLSLGLIPVGSLYAIGGIGYYSSREPAFQGSSVTNFGWNVGGGYRFPLTGFSAYVEARYHRISNADVSMVPLSFGLVF